MKVKYYVQKNDSLEDQILYRDKVVIEENKVYTKHISIKEYGDEYTINVDNKNKIVLNSREIFELFLCLLNNGTAYSIKKYLKEVNGSISLQKFLGD